MKFILYSNIYIPVVLVAPNTWKCQKKCYSKYLERWQLQLWLCAERKWRFVFFYPLDETSKYCPNLPYYGGLVGLLGEHAFQCSVHEMNDPREIILESVAGISYSIRCRNIN